LREDVMNQLQTINESKDSSSNAPKTKKQQQISGGNQQRTHQTKITHLFKAEEVKQGGYLDADEWHELLKTIEEQEAIAKLSNKKLGTKMNDTKSVCANGIVAADTSSGISMSYKFQRENMILVGRSLVKWISSCHEPSEYHLLLMQEYGAWLIQSDQLDQAVLFLRFLSDSIHTMKDSVSNKWRDIVQRTIGFIQEESRRIHNACLLHDS